MKKIYRCYTNHENFSSLTEGEFEAVVELVKNQNTSFNLYKIINIKKPNKKIQYLIDSHNFNKDCILLSEKEIVEELNEEDYPEYFI